MKRTFGTFGCGRPAPCNHGCTVGRGNTGRYRKTFPGYRSHVQGDFFYKVTGKVGELLEENHVFIENIDATIIAQAPKMRPHIDTMRENIAKALLIDIGQVNVKATTEEGLGFTGSGEGISSQAICLVTTPFDLTAQAVQGDVVAAADARRDKCLTKQVGGI